MSINMSGSGLQSSMWALPSIPTTGDWACPACSHTNYASRLTCFRCSHLKSDGIKRHTELSSSEGGDHTHQNSLKNTLVHTPHEHLNEQKKQYYIHHGHPSLPLTSSSNELSERMDPTTHGLATSRWAVRNQSSSGSQTVPVHGSTLKTSVNHSNSRSSQAQELGLPYQVQHYILTMIQHILEEGCWDFASRWAPDVLRNQGLTCSESVELAKWKNLLPDLVHSEVFVCATHYTLGIALSDAVKVRNAAAHRHLCNNYELKEMARKAQTLITMLSDNSRQDMLHRLRLELDMWDRWNIENPDAANNRLKNALQEINKNPIDDMDWTPNAITLRALEEATLPIRNEDAFFDFIEPMEVD